MATWQDPKAFAIWLTIVLLIVIILIFCIIIFTRFYYKRLLQANNQLALAKLDYQKTLLQDSVSIQEQERKRVAMELHDNLISKLNTVLFAFRSQASHFSFEDLLEECVHTTRRISHDLSPPLLEENNIEELLGTILEPLKQVYAINYDCRLIITSLPKENKLQVLRIAQEVVNNIVKHAQANAISMKVRLSKHYFAMIIQDDGIGFNTQVQSKGLGLKNIELRTQILKGIHRFSQKNKSGSSFILCFKHA